MGRPLPFLAVAVALVLAAPAPASGAVTIGSDLAPNPVNAGACNSTVACTAMVTAATGQTSPINGVLVRWRVRADNGTGETTPIRVRVLRHLGSNFFLSRGTGATELFADSALTTRQYATRLPIAAGEQLAIDILPPSGNFVVLTGDQAGLAFLRWEPPLADNDSRDPDLTNPDPAGELMLNGDVEPDADLDGFGDETQDACPTSAATQGACPAPQVTPTPANPTPPQTTPPRQRCKKKKRKKAAAGAARKCKKKR
jgi:hypothetical protein